MVNKKKTISIIGLNFDKYSSFLKGCSKASALIKKALFSDSMNLCTESGITLDFDNLITISEEYDLNTIDKPINEIFEITTKHIQNNQIPAILGGDHSVTFPVVKALNVNKDPINILHFDAHPDLYEIYQKNLYSHASPFARIMENGLCNNLVQVGIRTLNDHQLQQAQKYDVTMIKEKEMAQYDFKFKGPLYISFDMDVFDPAFAPGVSHYEPGGLSIRSVLNILKRVKADQIIGFDLVEYNPKRDINDVTSYVGAKILKELLGKTIEINGMEKPETNKFPV